MIDVNMVVAVTISFLGGIFLGRWTVAEKLRNADYFFAKAEELLDKAEELLNDKQPN